MEKMMIQLHIIYHGPEPLARGKDTLSRLHLEQFAACCKFSQVCNRNNIASVIEYDDNVKYKVYCKCTCDNFLCNRSFLKAGVIALELTVVQCWKTWLLETTFKRLFGGRGLV